MRHSRLISLVFHLAVVSGTTSLHAQQTAAAQPPASQLQHANTLFTQRDWAGALEAYRALSNAFPTHALSRFRVGVALVELGRAADGETSLREGERLGVPPAQSAYRLAQSLAEQQRADAAISELLRAAAGGLFLPPSSLDSDRHFATLKQGNKWRAVLDAFDAIVQPCLHDKRFREFDFWLGDWDVRPTGTPPAGPAGRNTITLDDNGCVITEHWSAPSGSVGQSFNIFDRSIGQWRQTWVDNVGGQHDYRGNLKDGTMAYVGDTPAPNGQRGRVPTRLTFFPISRDSLRQFSEISNDSGRTWQTSYDLTYVRRPATDLGPLVAADRAALLAIDSAFVRGWLGDDTTGVLSVFNPTAVLIPPGSPPVTGLAAIRAYWWPMDGSHTRILSFDRTIAEVGGDERVAWMRGTSALKWASTKNGKTTEQSSRSTDLFLFARDSTGRWRVIRQMWTALP